MLADGKVTSAAGALHLLDHMLLRATLPEELEPARQQAAARLAEALLDGSTPPVALPFLTRLLEHALQSGVVQMPMADKARRERPGVLRVPIAPHACPPTCGV